MKALILFLALAGGAGLFFRDQLESLAHSPNLKVGHFSTHRQAPAGVYYLRTSVTFPTEDGAGRWSPGQEVREVADMSAARGFITLTDGVNTAEVPQNVVTRDMDDAAALRQVVGSNQDAARSDAGLETNLQAPAARQSEASRQMETSRQADASHLVSGRFHPTTLDAPAVRTALPHNIVSTASAPVLYPGYGTVIVNPAAQPANRASSGVNTAPSRR